MSSNPSMVEYYARRAREYERIYAKPERQGELQELRKFAAELAVGRDVLEIACGTGYWTEVLAENAHSVLALDLNQEVLEIARGKTFSKERVLFAEADVYALPEFPRRFNACFAGFWWSHCPKLRLPSFLTGLHRCLTSEATVAFIDNVFVAGSSTPLSRRDAEGNTYQNRVLDDGRSYEVLKNFPVEEELREALAGMATEVRIEYSRYYWRLTYFPLLDAGKAEGG